MSGYVRILKLKGIPVYIHWSLPIAGIIISAFIGFELSEVIYYSIAFFLLALVHELGHSIAAIFLGLKVYEIKLSCAGGSCLCEDLHGKKSILVFYSGGLVFQLLLFILAVTYVVFTGEPKTTFLACLFITFTYVNAITFFINIIPSKSENEIGTDGYYLWTYGLGSS
jgi:hypothetical protein